MKITFIATVYNEEKTVGLLLESLGKQSQMPDEVIIVDGGSTDATPVILGRVATPESDSGQARMTKLGCRIQILTKKGNRAVGRNEAIKQANGNIIVCSDAGCVLDKDWVKNITESFKDDEVDVVAGYYQGKPESVFQKCLVPYVLVMPDRVDPKNFLPATRSMAFRKSVWEKAGGFPEEYSHNEDYVFAKKLKQIGANIVFAKDAIVYWQPRKNLLEAFVMFFRFAYGDAEARILRPKVLFLFARYFFVFLLVILLFDLQLYAMFLFYASWAIAKNYKYVKEWRAIVFLPILQGVSDMAVILGSIFGIFDRFLGGGYARHAARGVGWIGALRGVTRVVSFGKVAILARLLSPAQFGVYGIAALVLSFLDVLTETGVNVILVQEKDNIDTHISSAWVISILRGILMSVVLLAIAPFISSFFHSPDSLFLLQLISIVPLLRGFINPSIVKFQKDLQFKKEFLYRTFLFTIDAGSAVLVAFATHTAASIVVGLIVGVIAEVVLSFFVAKPRPTFRFEPTYFAKIFHRGKWITLSGVFQYLFQNVDNIVVGRMLGTGPLGLYQLGYSISILPISEVGDVVSRVTFPVYTKIAHDTNRLRKAFFSTVMSIAFVTIPFGVILFLFPDQLITLAFGKQWIGVAPALRILAIFGVIRAVFGFCATLFLSVGKQEYVAFATLASIFAMGTVIVPFVSTYGLIGAAYAALVGSISGSIVFIFFTWKILSKRDPEINLG